MKKNNKLSWFLLTGLIVLSVALLLPSFFDFSKKYPFKSKINLGLDLQGGLYMVLGIDFTKVYRDELNNYLERFNGILKKEDISVVVEEMDTHTSGDPRQAIRMDHAEQKEEIMNYLQEYFGGFLRLVGEEENLLEYGLSSALKKRIQERSVGKSIEIIRNRIDEFGVTEPEIFFQGKDRIIVQLPGVRDIERAKELIGKTARLEFKLVNDTVSVPVLMSWVEKAGSKGIVFEKGTRYSVYLNKLNDVLKKDIPKGHMLAFEKQGGQFRDGLSGAIPYLLEKKARLTGDSLQDARVQIDPQRNMPYVSLDFKSAEASVFEKVTGENIGKRMAIVLDGNVYSAPHIQSRIGGGRAQITLGAGPYNTLFQQASDLALVLRAGALPVQLDFLEQRSIGPGLGQDSIEKARKGIVMGTILLFIVVLFYYRVAGAIAIFTLVVNVLFVLAALVLFEATLTLPGMAGIALTVGMAVDANIVIYERIREEIRNKTDMLHYKAVEMGFNRVFWTIVDANITTALAGICLFNFGTGPIRGFAVTLLIGICSTVYCSYFVGRMIFNNYMDRLSGKKPAIG